MISIPRGFLLGAFALLFSSCLFMASSFPVWAQGSGLEDSQGDSPAIAGIEGGKSGNASSKPTSLNQSFAGCMDISATGKQNAIKLDVKYHGLPANTTHLEIYLKSPLLANTLERKVVKLPRKENGNISASFTGLCPDSAYSFWLCPLSITEDDEEKIIPIERIGELWTLPGNTVPIYGKSKAIEKVSSDLAKRKSTGDFFLRVSKREFNDIGSNKLAAQYLFTERLESDSTKRLGSLIGSFLDYEVEVNGLWRDGNNCHVGLKIKSLSTKKQQREYKKVLSWYATGKKQIKGKKGVKTKVKTLATYLMANCSYDREEHDWSYSERGVILHKKAVCSGYSRTFAKLCAFCGIKCDIVENKAGTHAWNLVKVGKKWYHYDVTWNDCAGSESKYSFMGSKQVARVEDHGKPAMTPEYRKTHPIPKKSLAW